MAEREDNTQLAVNEAKYELSKAKACWDGHVEK